MNNILVCPVAYNERVKLRNAIERFLRSPVYSKVDYCIVDDGSDDGTVEMLAGYAEKGVRTIKHGKRLGVGAAIRTAFQHAVQNGYEVIVIMAGNDKDNPDEIPLLLEPIQKEDYDVVQGSRYLGGNRAGGEMPFYRKCATKLHPWLFSFLTRHRLTDSTNGFRAIRLAVLKDKRINLDQEWLEQYELEPYLLFKAVTLGYRFKEVMVTKIYPPKKLGYTKMRPVVGWWSILRPLIYLGLGLRK